MRMWFIVLFIALCCLLPSSVPFQTQVLQAEWCIILDLERNEYQRLRQQVIENEE